jgi:hypothetical protein
MEKFTAYNPTSLHFGKNVTDELGEIVNQYGKRILLMYGKGSIKKNGIYDKVMEQLNSIGAEVFEYSGIKSNPVVDDVYKATEYGMSNNVNVILSVGGGSVLDSAKITSLSLANKVDTWDLMKRKIEPKSKIPVISVLTLAATGSEMNGAAVLQNHGTKEKIGLVHPLNYPNHSFLDPQFTYSVSKDYTAYGVADLMVHTFESFFGEGDASLSDRFVEAICKEAMEYGPKVLKEPKNYEYRANIMWAATNALNGLCDRGRKAGDWGTHAIGHILSYLYDTPHGATLTIASIAWMKLQKERIPERVAKLGEHLFGTNTADETIHELKQFFQSIDCPVNLTDINISENQKDEILELMNRNKVNGIIHQLSDEDREKIVDFMYEK